MIMKDILSLRLHVSLYPLPAFSFVLSNGHTKRKTQEASHNMPRRQQSPGHEPDRLQAHSCRTTYSCPFKEGWAQHVRAKTWEGIFYRLTHEGGLPIDTLGQELVRLLPSNTQLLFDIFSARFLDQEITQGGNRNHQTENST